MSNLCEIDYITDFFNQPAPSSNSTISTGGTITGNLIIDGNTTLNGTTQVNGQFNVYGSEVITTNLSVGGNETLSGTLAVTGVSTFNNTVNVNGALNVTGSENITGNLLVGGSLGVTDGLNVGGNTVLTGNLTLGGNFINTSGKIILSASDLGLSVDGYTDDSIVLQNALSAYSDIGTPVEAHINSPLGMAIYNIVNIGSNITLKVSCKVYFYGDGGFRFTGSELLGSNQKLLTNVSYSSGSTSITLANTSALSELTVGCQIKIRGRSDANGNTIESETNRVTAIGGTYSNVLTLLNPTQYTYKYLYTDQPYTDYTFVLVIKGGKVNNASYNPLSGDTTLKMDSIATYERGQMVELLDYALIKNVYPSNTSNNTFRDDVNYVYDIDVTNSTITLQKPLVQDYDVNTYPLYVVPIQPTKNSQILGAHCEHRKYPTNRNRHMFHQLLASNCLIDGCSIDNKRRISDLIVSTVSGSTFNITESTGSHVLNVVIPNGVYNVNDFCSSLGTALSTASTTNNYTYSCTYSSQTGKITLSTSGTFTINGTATTGYVHLGLLRNTNYTGTSVTGSRIDLSGAFQLPSTNNKFYFQESGQIEQSITFDSTTWYNLSTLLLDLQTQMNTISLTPFTYTIDFTENNVTTGSPNPQVTSFCEDTLSWSSTGVFNINLDSKTDTIYKYVALHDAKGNICSTADYSGASSYSSLTNSDTVVVRLSCCSKGHGFRIDESIDCTINNCLMGPTTHVSSGESYSFAFYRCSRSKITNCTALCGRHSCLFQTANNNILSNFISQNARISDVDFHGLNSRYNLVDGIHIIGGSLLSPDASSHSALKLGNTTHTAGDSWNTIKNVKIVNYADLKLTNMTTYGIYLYPISNDNIFENIDCSDCNVGIMFSDVSSKNSAVYQMNRNIVRNCYFKNVNQPFYISPRQNGNTLCTIDTFTLENCTFDNFGYGSSYSTIPVIANIKYCTDVSVKNCTFVNVPVDTPTANDNYTIYLKQCTGTRIERNIFKNVRRGCAFDTGCSTYYFIENIFDSLTGASKKYWNDYGNSVSGLTGTYGANTPTVYNNRYLGFTPVEELAGTSGTITRSVFRSDVTTLNVEGNLAVGTTGGSSTLTLNGLSIASTFTYTIYNVIVNFVSDSNTSSDLTFKLTRIGRVVVLYQDTLYSATGITMDGPWVSNVLLPSTYRPSESITNFCDVYDMGVWTSGRVTVYSTGQLQIYLGTTGAPFVGTGNFGFAPFSLTWNI